LSSHTAFSSTLVESEVLSAALRPESGVKEEVRWSLDGFRVRSTRLAKHIPNLCGLLQVLP